MFLCIGTSGAENVYILERSGASGAGGEYIPKHFGASSAGDV